MSELARVFGLEKSTLTSMLDRLEGRSILVRSVNPDRRVTPVDRRGFDAVMTAIAAVTEVEVRPQRPDRKETKQ